MTPERQKWWGSLPKREKILRKELSYLKYQRSKEKERMSIEQNGTSKKFILERINYYTTFIRAVRYELALEMLWKEKKQMLNLLAFTKCTREMKHSPRYLNVSAAAKSFYSFTESTNTARVVDALSTRIKEE